ncbi:MAG: hypothetical protein Q9163_004795 [Psora crenata]
MVPSARLWFRYQAQKLVRPFDLPPADSTANRGLQLRAPRLREKTNHPVTASPPPPPPLSSPIPADVVLSSIFDTQTESSDGTLKDIGSSPASGRKERADTGDEHSRGRGTRHRDRTATCVIGIRGSSKRTAGNAGWNKGAEGVPRSGKVRRTDNPFVIGDDGLAPGETGGSTRATSVELKMGPIALQSPTPKVQAEARGYLSTYTTEPTTETIDRPTSQVPFYLSIYVGGSSAKTTTEQQQSQVLAVPSPYHFLRTLIPKMPHLKSRNGRS